MFSSETISRNMNSSSTNSFLFPNENNPAFKHASKEMNMSALDFYQNQQNCGGLARYRSAPSSFIATLWNSGNDDNSSSEESETILRQLMNQNKVMKQEIDVPMEQQNGFSHGTSPSQVGYANGGNGVFAGSFSVGMENVRINCGIGNRSNLARQSSSPAGFFNGFGVMGEVGSYGMNNNAEPNSSMNGLKNHVNCSSGMKSSSRFMPSIPENCNESIGPRGPENGNSDSSRAYEAALLKDCWNNSSFNSLKRNPSGDLKMFSNLNGLMANEETVNAPTRLAHHLSLPKVSSEMASVEKFLQFQDHAIPCQIRAKRGCATHPRSIAERMRRTRISERMKKLQELCPNMDKQTNTADMLDMAVEYIKELQNQVKTLTEKKANCTCSGGLRAPDRIL